MNPRRPGLAVAAALAALAGSGVSVVYAPDGLDRSARSAPSDTGAKHGQTNAVDRDLERVPMRSRGAYTPRSRRPVGNGWPVATDRRRAKKARNVARNRKAQKRAGR